MAIQSAEPVAVPLAPPAPAESSAAGAAATTVPMPYVAQTEDNWCWAACAQMLFGRPGSTPRSQCQVASAYFGQTCCPSPGAPSACDLGAWPQVAYPPQGIPTSWIQTALTQAQVEAELAAGRPVQVCLQWSASDSTHVALIVGQNEAGDFEVYDPIYGAGSRSFDQIWSAYGLGAWIYSFTF